MKNILRTFVGIYMSLLSCLACSFATQFYCFLCKWGSGDRKYNYVQKQWPKLESLILGQKNAVNTPLINPEKFIYLRCTSHLDSEQISIEIALDLCI
jgi:hypothetical protein